jgi:glycerate kinase
MWALGARLLDADGEDVPPVPHAVQRVAEIDTGALDPRLAGTLIEVALDVDAPLLGARGAAAVFGPQKGATAAIVPRLAHAMKHWAGLLSALDSHPDPMSPGAGAAGGTAFAALALGAELLDGADAVLDLVDFDTAAADATLIITGEGRLDQQTLMGKAPVVVARRAQRLGRPVIAVVGSRDQSLGDDALSACGFDAVYQLLDVDQQVASDVSRSHDALVTVGAQIARSHLPDSRSGPTSPLPVSAGSTTTR